METLSKPKLCIYCGSAFDIPQNYADAAADFVRLAVARGFDIVYGAGSCGLMGIVADAALEAGGHVTGVVPRQFEKEVVHQGLSETIFTSSMSERKRVMLEVSDTFVALPGGYGTLDEITEALTLLQLGAIEKPCGFLNTNAYYKNFFLFLDNAVSERFISRMHRGMALLSEDPSILLDMIQRYKRPHEKLWWNENLNSK
jgi:uncharacterized protein (TIGR00730 family)